MKEKKMEELIGKILKKGTTQFKVTECREILVSEYDTEIKIVFLTKGQIIGRTVKKENWDDFLAQFEIID